MPKWSRGIGQWWTTDIREIKLENLPRLHRRQAAPRPA